MKQRSLCLAIATTLTAGFVAGCAQAEDVSRAPAKVAPLPTIEPSPAPSPEKLTTALPDVIGKRIRKARSILETSGFFVTVSKKTSQQPPGTVLAMSSEPGSELEPGERIRVIVAKAAPPLKIAAEPEPNCHPSYEGACLNPNASDYDCAGGSGNGPEYTGTVTVVGPDVFDLDADDNGVGCD